MSSAAHSRKEQGRLATYRRLLSPAVVRMDYIRKSRGRCRLNNVKYYSTPLCPVQEGVGVPLRVKLFSTDILAVIESRRVECIVTN